MYCLYSNFHQLFLILVGSLLNTTTNFCVVQNFRWIVSKMSLLIFQFHFSTTVILPVTRKKLSLLLLFLHQFDPLPLFWCSSCVSFRFRSRPTLLQSLFWVNSSVWIKNPNVKECFLAQKLLAQMSSRSSLFVLPVFLIVCLSPFNVKRDGSNLTSLHTSDKSVATISLTSLCRKVTNSPFLHDMAS